MNNPAYGEGVYSIYQLMINNYYNLSIVVQVHNNVQTDVNPVYETSTPVKLCVSPSIRQIVQYETVW